MATEWKRLVSLGDARKLLREFPTPVRQKFGRTLAMIQTGDTPTNTKRLTGFSISIQEIRVRHSSDTYRAVYTVSLGNTVYLLHAFQKKSKSGIALPPRDKELIQRRIREAITLEAHDDETENSIKAEEIDNIFDALDLENGEAEAARCALAGRIFGIGRERNLSDEALAKSIGCSTDRLAQLHAIEFDDFTIDELCRYLVALGHGVRIVVEPTEEAHLTIAG